MKLSDKILEEHGRVSVEYIKKREKFPRSREEYSCNMTLTLRDLTQAYKDALFMEGEIEKKEGLKVCEHKWHTIQDSHTDKFVSTCQFCESTLQQV